MLGGKDVHTDVLAEHLASEGVHLDDALDLVAPELHPHRDLLVGGEDLQRVAAHAELARGEDGVVALVENGDQVPEESLPVLRLPLAEADDHPAVLLRVTQAIDAGDRGHDDDVAPGEERRGRREAQAVDLVVDLGVLFDVRIGAREVRLGLVIVIVGDKVLDGVLGKELFELGVQLRREGLVGDDQRRALERLDHLGHHVRLAEPVTPRSVW